MQISKIYKSTSPYQWQAGKHKRRAHKKAVAKAKNQLRPKRKISAMGWPM